MILKKKIEEDKTWKIAQHAKLKAILVGKQKPGVTIINKKWDTFLISIKEMWTGKDLWASKIVLYLGRLKSDEKIGRLRRPSLRLSDTPTVWRWLGVGLTVVVGLSISSGISETCILESRRADLARVCSICSLEAVLALGDWTSCSSFCLSILAFWSRWCGTL